MTFKHKLSCRLALLKDRGLITAIAVLAAAAVVNCERPLSTTDPITSVARVVISPNSVTLQPNESADFTAASFTAAGDSSPVGVLWHASSGVISDTGTTGHRHYGRYKNASCGDYLLIASNSPGWRSDTAKIAVRCPVAVASVAVSPASAALQVSQTVQLAATPQDTSGNPLAGRVVTWASSNIAVAPVTASGLVTAVAVGSATITATSEGKTGTAAVAVAIVPVASVAVTPASATLQAGQTVQLAATPKDANGNALSGRVIGWSSSNPSVATVNASGLVTGVAAGSATITAVSEGKSGGAAITVNPAPVPVASVAVTPASATVQAGQTVQLAATPKDANGNPLSGRVVTWVSGNSAVATVNAGGLVTSAAAGSATITATSEGQSGTATITVTTVPVASVAVTPAATSLPTGGTVQLTAIPKDANGTPLTGRSVAWTSSNGAVATVSSSGLVTAVATGSATITATSEGQSGSASITVSNAPVATVAVTPASASVQVGQTVPLTATPKDASGTPLSGRVISWSSSNTAVATVSSSGVVSGVAAGVATITATSEGQSGSSSITVSNVPVASVAVSPASASVQVGQTVQLTATPKDANGNPLSGRTISWSSSNTATASVNSTGLVTAVATGAATITATSEGQSGTASITVTPVPVATVAVTPASASVDEGKTVQLTATPKDVNGNPLSGRVVTWTSSNTAAATVSSSGLVTAKLAGSTTITATSEGQSGTAAITVVHVAVASVAVAPASASVNEGQTVQLTATLKDANGNTLTGRTVTWVSSNTAAATVSASGLVTGKLAGAATITATSEAQSGTSAITVVHVPVASVAVTPASASVSTGQTVQLTATPKDASGNALAGRTVSWASSNTAVETVTNSGLVSGVTAGAATITATSETVSGTSAITVTAAASSFVLVGAGDIADCDASPTAALLDNIPGTVFTAGDNAYPNGSSSDYSQCYNPSWGRHKARTRPSPGNHDHNTSGAAGYFGYFGAQAGPSGLGYYSYDLGAWHIISLDSNIDMSAGSAQETWLRADLAASTKRCAIAYWHHPRFSSGTNHGSEPATQPLWQALYDFGAEIVISGHDHEYERFAPQTPNGSADPARGIREFVVGTGGAGLYSLGTPLPNSEIGNDNSHGVLKLTLSDGSYTWEFVPVTGDSFRDSGSGTCH